jgi:TonB family protein
MSTDVILANLLAWSLQITAVVCAGGALPALLRVDAPGLRHGYWRALLLLCLMLPVVQPWQAAPLFASDVAALETTGLAPAASGASASSAPTPLLRVYAAARPMMTSVAVVLAAGAVIRLAWLGLGLVRLRRLRREGVLAAVPVIEDDLDTLVRAGAEVRYVTALRQPITFGAWRPIVLLPAALRRQPEPVRRAVLVHELWHVRRRDWLWVVIEEVVCALFWFHPAVGWVVSRVQASREEVVDELTVLTTNARRTYIEALLLFADEPGVYPATSFARRRHLFRRVLLISKEAVMSSKRIAASCAAMGVVVVMGGWYGAEAFPLRARAAVPQQSGAAQPRDVRPGEPRPASRREIELVTAVKAGAQPGSTYMELARLQEARGATKEAEATLVQARATLPADRAILLALSGLYNRTGQFDQTIETMEQAASLAPSDMQAQHLAATFYEEKVRKDTALSPGDRLRYIQAGVAAEDRALALNPDYVDAMIVKNILMRHQANTETSASVRAQLIADADALRNRAIQLQQSRQLLNSGNQPATVSTGADGRMPPPPPPPPPPGARVYNGQVPPPPPPPPPPSQMVDGQVPVRVGGEIKVPTKLVNVPPIYPEEAKDARVQGVVIIEAVVDASGTVGQARVLRSIPMLDQAAVDAVKQWVFTPTLVNGAPAPVVMTVTVNFTLQ